MGAIEPHTNSMRFSTSDLPRRDRVSFWHDFFGRHVVRMEFQPLSKRAFDAEGWLWSLPGLRIHRSSYSAPTRLSRPRELICPGDNNIAIMIDRGGTIAFSHSGRDISLGRGGAVIVLHEKPAIMEFPAAQYMAVMAPLSAIRPLTNGVEDRAGRSIPANNEALRLLSRYVDSLCNDPMTSDMELSALAASHVYDLMALAMGATRDGAEMALHRGVGAARLESAKSFVLGNLREQGLSVQAVAKHHGVTPRYIHMLFEREGITFSMFVLEQRLLLAHRLLRNARHADMSITAIAFAAGFSDVSHFNRSFRRRFGARPTDIRTER